MDLGHCGQPVPDPRLQIPGYVSFLRIDIGLLLVTGKGISDD
jgi:hypothetical protein